MHILIVDEEEFVREGLQRVLTNASRVSSAGSVAEGLNVLRAAPVDLIIMDVVLTGGTGIPAIREFRREFPNTRIIAMAGSGSTGLSSYHPDAISTNAYLAASSQAGADATLAKPFETAELRDLIERVTGKRS